jgi:hypothetical protein
VRGADLNVKINSAFVLKWGVKWARVIYKKMATEKIPNIGGFTDGNSPMV